MQRGGQTVHAKPKSLTFADFEYIWHTVVHGVYRRVVHPLKGKQRLLLV